jgi:hypothetical protein
MGWEQWVILILYAVAIAKFIFDRDFTGVIVALGVLLLLFLGGFFSGSYEDGYIDACKSLGGVTLHTAEGEPICVTGVHNAFSR